MIFQEFITSRSGKIHCSDDKATIDIFDMADMLTRYFQESGFLQAGETIHAYDLEPILASVGYYLTIERKNDVLSVRRAAR